MLRKGDEPVPGYRLVRFLGKGQYGEVWEAKGPGGTRVALKFIDVSGAQGQKELRGVQRVKEIRHPHLMPITALWLLDEEGTPLDDSYFQTADGSERREGLNQTLKVEAMQPSLLVVAMGYCDENLSDRLKEVNEGIPEDQWHGIPVEELLVYLVESAKAIDFLNSPRHDLGDGPVSIQHCDIKPANIMLVGGAVQVCDFGLARMMGDNLKATATGMVGSPAFMAPECIRKRPSSSSDQYSLAITYYELRTGHLPFRDLAYMAVFEAHQSGDLDFSAVGDAEREVLRKATELEPTDRYASCMEMVTALQAALVDEFPNLRASPGSGTLRPGQSGARASATDTVRVKGTAPEGQRRPRRAAPWGVKLSLALALLVLAGMVAIAVISGGRGPIVTPGDPPIDYTYTAQLAEAEKKLQDGDLVDAAARFEQLEQSLSESDAEASASLRDSARLGTLRVKVRQGDADWAALLEQVRRLQLETASDVQNAKRAIALELIAKAAIGKTPVSERIEMLVRLEPPADHLDAWEQDKISAVELDASAELAQATGSIDAAVLANLKILGIDHVSLLLALAERQYGLSDFELSRETLGQAWKEATGEQQTRLEELLLMNALADDAFEAKKAVATFALVATKVQDPTGVVALLLERARRNPEVVDLAVEQLDQLRQAASGRQAQLDQSYASLLTLRIRSRLAASDVSLPDLMRDCKVVQAIDDTDPLVNACWVEGRILSPGSELDRETWMHLDTIVQQAIDTKDAESSHVAYFHFVAGLLLHHHPTPRSRDGAEEILKIRDMDAALLEVPHRRRQIAEVLVAGAAAIGLPKDADLLDRLTARDDTKTAYSYLEFAFRWEGAPPSDAWKANYIIAAALVGDPQALDKWLPLSDEMLASEVSTAFLESEKRIGQVMLLSARGYQQRYEEGRQLADRDKAIQRYAGLITRLHNPRRVDPEFADLALYTQVVQPAYELAKRSFSESAEVPAELKPSLARIYGTSARLLERDEAVGRLAWGETATSGNEEQAFRREMQLVTRAEQEFRKAEQLEARPEYLVGVARAIINSSNYVESLSELQSLAVRVLASDARYPEGHTLKGSALVIESRLTTKRSESRELLLQAIEACKEAVQLGKPGDDDYAINYEVLSTAELLAAFFADARDAKQTHLAAAEEAAHKATEVKNRPRPENAFNCLGNALEDQAYYLGDVAKYKPALEAFIDGAGAAADAGRDTSKSLSAAGRCRLRQAQFGQLRESEKDLALNQADAELNRAIAICKLSAGKKGIEHRLAEAQYWRSEVIRRRALNLPATQENNAEKLRVLGEAEVLRKESVALAKESESINWDEYQVELARLTWNQAQFSGSVDEAKKFLNTCADRAQEVLTENALETSSLQISPTAIRDALSQLVNVDLLRADLLIEGLTDSQWTLAREKEAEGYGFACLESAERIQDAAISRSARIAARTMLGNIKLKSARNPDFRRQAAAALDSAEKSYQEAVGLAGAEENLAAGARLGLQKIKRLREELNLRQ